MADPFDQLKDLSDADQTTAALKTLADALSVYFHNLLDRGFTRAEALTITVAWQTAALASGKSQWENR